MRPEGYAIWTSAVKPDLARAAGQGCPAARAPRTQKAPV
jgi:hypothetical protein